MKICYAHCQLHVMYKSIPRRRQQIAECTLFLTMLCKNLETVTFFRLVVISDQALV
jgi:hypothetical protein